MIQDALDLSMDYLTPAQYAQTARAGPVSPDMLENVPQKLKDLHRTLESFRDFFETPESGSDPMPIPMSWCSPKVRKLAETLFERYTDSFQGIIFVEQRHVATCLAVILERIPLLAHIIKSEQLVGHGKDTAKAHTKGMGTRNQQDTVKMFRERAINVCRWSVFSAIFTH